MLSARGPQRERAEARSFQTLCCGWGVWALLLAACNGEGPAERTDTRGATDADAAPPPMGAMDAAAPSPQDASVAQRSDVPAIAEEAAAAPDAVASDALASDASVEAPSSQRASLVLPERWQLLDAGEDPFQDRPAVVDCLPGGVTAETLADERVLGVETSWCGYLTALQPSLRAVAAGELLKVRLWHFELSAPEPAEAHAVVLVDGLRVLDERIPIPKPGGLLVRQLRAERAIAAGAPVHFHLHNHGANSWALVEVSSGPEELPRPDAGSTAGDAAPP